MNPETHAAVEIIKTAVILLKRHVDWERALKTLSRLESEIAQPSFWDNQENAQKVMREKTHLDSQVTAIRHLEETLTDQIDMVSLATEEGDAEMIAEAEAAIGEEKDFSAYLYYATKLGTAQMFFQQALEVKPKDTNALTELAYNHLSQHLAALQKKGNLHDYDKTPHVIKALKIAYDLKAACKINCGYVTKLFAEANRVDAEKLKP